MSKNSRKAAALVLFVPLVAAAVPVRHVEGELHAFLSLKTMAGAMLADGDMTQVLRRGLVTSRLAFHYRDGSDFDQTAIFSQQREFRLVSFHLTEKGPAFRQPLRMDVECKTGQVTVNYTDDHGRNQVISQHLDLPPDLANGLVPILLKNVRPTDGRATLPMLVATPEPRLVKLLVTPMGEEAFSTGSLARKAQHYVIKVEIGGITGVLAQIFGKTPPNTDVWMLGGEAPVIVRCEGPLDAGLPATRIELATPVWPAKDSR